MPEKLKIVIHPHEILRKKAEIVDIEEITTPKFQKLIDDMIYTAQEEKGVGLAAPQIAKSIRLFIAKDNNDIWNVFINPKILSKSLKVEFAEEGCLSIPGKTGYVKRHKRVLVEFYDREGTKRKIKADSFFARVIQHEYDHLEGILFIDKL